MEGTNTVTPGYYNNGTIECIDAIKEATRDIPGSEAFMVGCIIKYLWRYRKKGGVEDLKKSEKYLKLLIDECKRNDKANDISKDERGCPPVEWINSNRESVGDRTPVRSFQTPSET